MKCKLVLAAAVAAMASSAAFAAGRTMLAVPARHDMVGFGFDMLKQLPGNLELACYKGEDRIERIEVFDRSAWEWRTISAENWASGLWRADSLVIAGENKAAAELLAISGWTQQAKMPSDRAKLEVVNAVNSFQPLTEKQWASLGATYGFKFIKVEQPSPRERLRDQARARRAKAREQKEEERAVRETMKAQRKALEDAEKARLQEEKAQMEARKAQPKMEIVPVPLEAEPADAKPVPAVKPAPTQIDKTLPAPFEGSSAIDELPAALDDAAKLKTAEAKASAVKAPEAKAADGPTIVFKKREPAAEAKVPEAKIPEAKPTESEAKVRAAVEAAVSEAAAKAPKVEATPAPAPAAVEVRVPAREAIAPKVETSVAPATIPEATPAKIPEVKPAEVIVPEVKAPAAKPAEVTVPEVKVPAAKPVEVAAPDVKVPEVKPVQTPEIKVPAIVLDPM